MAPHTAVQAVKTSILAAAVFEELGMRSSPAPDARRTDIIQALEFGTPERMVAFCQAIQAASPIDSMAEPEPWDMPGYADPVIMAAGAFVSGASIELSADGPMRAPYAVYLQGGLTYAHGRHRPLPGAGSHAEKGHAVSSEKQSKRLSLLADISPPGGA